MIHKVEMVKVSELTDWRVLARTLVYGGGVRRLALTDRGGSRWRVSDFDRETANTVFADGVVVAVRRDSFADADVAADFTETLKSLREINVKTLHEVLVRNKKAASEGDAAENVALFLMENAGV